jgi:hypothetical protein
MRHRYLVSLGALVILLAFVSLAAVSMKGQNAAPKGTPAPRTQAAPKTAAAPKPTAAPKTPWGDPDLQGTWFVMESVPLERSAANANKQFLTEDEVAALDKQKSVDPGRNARSANQVQDVGGAYNAVFNSVLRTSRRTSMIIDPPDGKIPPLTAEAQQRQGRGAGRGGAGAGFAGPRGGNPNDNPETTAQSPRCLGVQMPFLPLNTLFAQGTVMQIVQGPKSMGIYMEDDHAGGGNRVVFMDNRPHAPASVKSVLGDSRGHWDGNTLVVETTNFDQGYRGANPDTYKMTERFTRVDSNNLKREITFEDPKTWTRPWTILIEMGKTSDQKHMIFDSACHEGNYGLTGILVGARREEQAAKKK